MKPSSCGSAFNSMDCVRQTRSRTRQVSGDSTSDRISNLPCDILDKILICLPIQEAARTSILSRRWRFRWLYTPKLVFHKSCSGDSDNFFRNCAKSTKSRREIVSWIYQILQRQRGPLHKFILSIPSWVEAEQCFLERILLCLAGKDIQEFAFRCSVGGNQQQYKLPSTVFRFGHLTHLSLSDCELTIPPEFIGFSRLINLELHRIVTFNNDLRTFISKCPLLLHLKLRRMFVGNPLQIDAPNLEFLCFSCSFVLNTFMNVPLLSTVIIKSKSDPWPIKCFDFVKMFCSLPAIEYFYEDHKFIKYVYSGVIPERLPVTLNHLKSIEVCGLCFDSAKQVRWALSLIRSSPNLKKLKIVTNFENYNRDQTSQLYKSVSASEDCLNQLREVTMEKFLGLEPELEFLKFIIARSLVLKRVIICPVKRFPVEDERESFIPVTRLRRASPKAKFIYVDPK